MNKFTENFNKLKVLFEKASSVFSTRRHIMFYDVYRNNRQAKRMLDEEEIIKPWIFSIDSQHFVLQIKDKSSDKSSHK